MFDTETLNQIRKIISNKITNLLKILMKRNKVMWFKEILVDDPDESQLDYVDDVFAQYLEIISKRQTDLDTKDIRKLCKSVLKVV